MMHEFSPLDLAGVAVIGLVFIKILGPVARAFANRIEGKTPAPIAEDPAVDQLRDQVEELHERVDFLERTLASRPPPTELPQPRTPV
jgi:hypothetical protein